MENQEEPGKEHLAQARKINFDHDMANFCIDLMDQAIYNSDAETVLYWKLCFRALLDLDGSWNCEALDEYNLVMSLGMLASGSTDLEEISKRIGPDDCPYDSDYFKEPDLMDCSDIDDEIPF